MKSPEEIGKIVRELRGDVSLRAFAEKCTVSHTTIDNIEKGIDFRTGKPTQIKFVTLHKIAHACNVPISYLTGEESHFENTELSKGEKELLNIFRLIPKDQQNTFLEMGRLYANSLKKD